MRRFLKYLQDLSMILGTEYEAFFRTAGPVFSYKLRYIVGFGLVDMVISTNQKPATYRNLYQNTGPALQSPKK